MNHASTGRIGRRAFLENGSLVLATGFGPTCCAQLLADEAPKKGGVRVGLVTDLHYADKKPAGTRHYRETLDKLAEAAERFKKDEPAFVVELGDLIDAADSGETDLKRVNKEFAALSEDRRYVLGNHCVDTLTKKEFLDAVGQKEAQLLVRPRGRSLRRTRRVLPVLVEQGRDEVLVRPLLGFEREQLFEAVEGGEVRRPLRCPLASRSCRPRPTRSTRRNSPSG